MLVFWLAIHLSHKSRICFRVFAFWARQSRLYLCIFWVCFIVARNFCNCNSNRQLKTGNSNWHLPVICIILRERLFHFGLGNDADRTCHAAGLGAALLIAKILHGDGQKLLLQSSSPPPPVSMLLLSWLWQLKRANMHKNLGAMQLRFFVTACNRQISMRKSYFPISHASGAPIYSPISATDWHFQRPAKIVRCEVYRLQLSTRHLCYQSLWAIPSQLDPTDWLTFPTAWMDELRQR